jgi:hypothetical protein
LARADEPCTTTIDHYDASCIIIIIVATTIIVISTVIIIDKPGRE